MDSKNELKETDIKIGACYYFGDIISHTDVDLEIFSQAQIHIRHMKIF